MYHRARFVTLWCMRRRLAALSVLALLALGACSSTGNQSGGSAVSYSSPEEMSKKAWGPLGVSSCGGVDEAATYSGAHYVICDTKYGQVQFVSAETESAAAGAVKAMTAIGWVAEQSGTWAVGANDQAAVDAARSALG